MTHGRTRRARRLAATTALGGLALVAAGCDLGERPVPYAGPSGLLEGADLDGDGDTDLVAVSDSGTAEPDASTVLLNAGDGTFVTTVEAGTSDTVAFALGDLDGDGDVDRVDLVRTPDVFHVALQLRRGDGDGAFGAAESLGATGTSHSLVLDDLDDDGDLDVVTAENDGVVVRLGVGDGSLGAPTPFPAPDGAALVTTGDLDGDGSPDVVVGGVSDDGWASVPTVAVLPGDGAGGLGAATGPVAVGQPDDVDVPAGVAVADVDENGALDVVGTNNGTEGDLWAVPGDGSGGLTAPSWAPVSAGTDLGIGDIDGDGHLDAVVAKPGTAGAVVLYGDGDGHFGDPHPVGGASGARGLSVVVARLDAGPTVDVAVGRGQGTPQLTDVFLNTLEGRDH